MCVTCKDGLEVCDKPDAFHPRWLAGMFPDAFTHCEHHRVPPTHRLAPFPANVGHAGFSCIHSICLW